MQVDFRLRLYPILAGSGTNVRLGGTLSDSAHSLFDDLPEDIRAGIADLGWTEPMPVQPTAHYAMGGIPTDIDGRVRLDHEGTILPGLYAAAQSARERVKALVRREPRPADDTP